MSHPCQRKNPLVRSGTDRSSRQLPALATDYFVADERSLADFILFARRYMANIKFYGEGAPVDANWQPFFEQDISVNLATLASSPLKPFVAFKDELINYLKSASDEQLLREHFALLLQLPLLLLTEISTSKERITPGEPLLRQMEQWAARELEGELGQLLSFYLGAIQELAGYGDTAIDTTLLNVDAGSGLDQPLIPEKIQQRLTALTCTQMLEQVFDQFDGLDAGVLASTAANTAPFEASSNVAEQIEDALNYNLLINTVEHLLSATQFVIDIASTALEESLQRNDHEPSYGLWLTFLKLYRHPQQLLNQFTDRHLEFYYRDVLQLKNQPKQGDSIALVVELARQHNEYLLQAGTRFDAGKDDDGTKRIYELENDTVFNQAKIAQLKSFYHHEIATESSAYAADVTNSSDGQGEKLDKHDPSWLPFGPVHSNSLAALGFAVADEKLRLSDGDRIITLSFAGVTGFPTRIQNCLAAALTTEEDWLQLDSNQLTVARSGNSLVLTITLNGGQPAVTPYSADIHGYTFNASLPLLRVWLKPEAGNFKEWLNFRFVECLLVTEVRSSRNYSLSNDNGLLDPAKPFMPFGPIPKENSHFIVGGKELFSKPLLTIELRPKWQEKFGWTSHYSREQFAYFVRTEVEWLTKGKWEKKTEANRVPFFVHATDEEAHGLLGIALLFLLLAGKTLESLFEDDEFYTLLVNLGLLGAGISLPVDNASTPFDSLDEQRKASSSTGFVRFKLLDALGHRQYAKEYALSVMAKAPGVTGIAQDASVNYDNGIPKEPYTPVISELTLNYKTQSGRPSQFIHHYPFGALATAATNNSILPPLNEKAELYVGLENAEPPQSISLLFSAVEGSANPLKNPASLQWHYLSGDNWIEIPTVNIADSSAALAGSGIIAFELPTGADTRHAILPTGLHWLKLSVASDADAVAMLTGIYTQGVSVSWVDNNNANNMLATPLPVNAISRLVTPDTAIKSISQPLPSVDGKPEEDNSTFNLRVSERLRHKDRAVTIWDYEHLILQRFPQVYKVRCLNHTALCRDENKRVLAENGLHPGAVLVIPIPKLEADSASDPHRPYTTTKTLADINTFLRARISPFVRLEVQNPKIEEVQLKFWVAFHVHILDTGYYLKLLNSEINQYLMPWAYNHNAELDFNGSWYKSTLVNFIEERPYVNFIKDVEMFHRRDIEDTSEGWKRQDTDVIKTSTAGSILVSYAQHDIIEISEVVA